MFCSSCGKEIAGKTRFCPFCGASAETVQGESRSPSAANSISPGFSDKINDPSLRGALKQGGKATVIFAILMILAPVVIALILSVKDDNFTYLGIGGAISAVFLVVNLVSAARKKSEKQWDGVVIDKTTRRVHSRGGDGSDETFTQYVLVFREDSGKKRTLKEGTSGNSAHPYYDYLDVGDKVRYHPGFNRFYEKYDKTKDTYLYCALCGTVNDIREDRCSSCGAVLVK